MSIMIRRGVTGLAVAGLLAGGALFSVASPAAAAVAEVGHGTVAPQSPQDDVIAGPFPSREACELVPVVVPGGASCVFGARRGQYAWWLIQGGSVGT